MMGFGYLGNGGPSSSSSNLSPLAPPFTVDRSYPKSNSNPLGNFTEPPQYAVPYSSASHNWQYAQNSTSRPDFFSNRDSQVDSIRTTSLPSVNDYCYMGPESINPSSTQWAVPNPSSTTATDPFPYIGAPKQYYPPYASQVVDDDISLSLVGLNEPSYDLLSTSGLVPMVGSSQVDYTQSLSGLEFTPPWGGFWTGLAEGKQSKQLEANGSFCLQETDTAGSLVNKNYMKQGAGEHLSKRKEDPSISQRKDVLGKVNLGGSASKGQLDDKSVLVQNPGFIPVESSKALDSGNGTISPKSHFESASHESAKNSFNRPKSCGPYEKRFQLFDPCINVAVNSEDVGSCNPSKGKEPYQPTSSEGKDGCLDISHLSFHIGRNDRQIFAASSSTKEGLSDKLLTRNALDHANKARFEYQVPDINVPHDFSLPFDSSGSINAISVSSESIDHHNPAVDSPCWKGAPASQFSPFESLEAMPQHLVKTLEACNGLDVQGTQMLLPCTDTVKTSSGELYKSSVQNESLHRDNDMSLPAKRNLRVNFSAKGQKLSVAVARARPDSVDWNKSEGDQLPNNVNKPIKEYEGTKRISTSDASEDNCVPLHAVENVLCSPSSGEDAVKPHGRELCPKMNVQMLVNAMHNLSELVLFHCSNDACALNEKDHKTLEHVTNNIDACVSKKMLTMAPTKEPTFPRQGIFDMGGSTIKPHHMKNEVGASSHIQLNSQIVHEQNAKYDVPGMKFEKVLDFVYSRDDAGTKRYQKMVQEIKKALDENFQWEEELQLQSQLYKNLWLEAEAELCCTSFKARFNRMKIEMENCKSDTAKDVSENVRDVEKLPNPNDSRDLPITRTLASEAIISPIPKNSDQGSPIPSPTNRVHDVEASVMARFHILKSRDDNSNPSNVQENQLKEVDVGFSGKRNHWAIVGNPSGNKSFDVAVGSPVQHQSGHNSLDDPELETGKEFIGCASNDEVIQPTIHNRLQNQLATGWYDNSSSDWEHVLKDDFAWQK